MSNRAYLVANNDSRTAGSFAGELTYDPDTEIIAAASRLIPLLWLAAFSEDDVTHHSTGNEELLTLRSTTSKARTRFRSRLKLLKDTFPHNVNEIRAFQALLKDLGFRFLKVDAAEIHALDSDAKTRLVGAIRWFTSKAASDFQDLLDLSEINYDSRTKRCSASDTCRQSFHGYRWVRDVPWNDAAQEDAEAEASESPDVTFGPMAKRAMEEHPLLKRLIDIEYFSHVGEDIDLPWAVKRATNMLDAYLTHARATDWGFIKLAAWGPVMAWIRENLAADAEQFYRDQKDEIDTACLSIFWAAIMPRLPRKLKEYELPFDTAFAWDLMHMTIEYELVEKGMPAGFCTRLLQVYESGHFPCGWDGEYPLGKLIIH